MPTLYVLSGPELGRTVEVHGAVVLGRADDCDLVLHAASVSRRHARLEPAGDAWVLVDLGSRNGVFLGDVRGERFELHDGAVFRLGELELRLRLDVAAPSARPAASAPVVVTPPIDHAHEFESDEPVAPDLAGGVEIELENEEALDLPPPSTAASTASAPRAAAPPGAAPAPAPSAAARERRAAALERAGLRASTAGAAAGPTLRDTGRPVLHYSREVDRPGLLAADLAQYPAWVRGLAVALALALFAAIFWFAFRGAGSLKGGPASDVGVEVDVE